MFLTKESNEGKMIDVLKFLDLFFLLDLYWIRNSTEASQRMSFTEWYLLDPISTGYPHQWERVFKLHFSVGSLFRLVCSA